MYKSACMGTSDLCGQQFFKWTVLSRAENRPNGAIQWLCVCVCGSRRVITSSALKVGQSKGCRKCQLAERRACLGKSFGLLTITTVLSRKKAGGLCVRGKCTCGGIWEGPLDSLRRGNTRSCGCLPSGPKPHPNREVVALKRVLRNYRRHARRRSLVWSLTDLEFQTLLKKDCYYCGAPPSTTSVFKAYGPRKSSSTITYNGIDRKDNTLGYTIANTVACCKICNFAKQDLEFETFLDHIKKMYVKLWAA